MIVPIRNKKKRRMSRDTVINTTTATTPLTNHNITQVSAVYYASSTIAESCFEASVFSGEKTMEHIKLLKSPFHRDIRRAYPKLFVDAFNTWSVDHMKNVMNLMAAKDCQLIEVHPSKHRLPNRHIIGRSSAHRYNAIMLTAFPDAVYDIEEFKLKQVAHIPKLFDKIALRLMTDGDYEALDTYLLQVADKASEEPTRGFILCGKYSFNGTKLLDIVVEQDHTPFTSNSRINVTDINDDTANITLIPTPGYESKFKPNVMLSGTFVWTLNSDNKVSRFEYHSE
jgi:hypothetical protein